MANAPRLPTLEDLDALPAGTKGEIIDGVLYTMTRPRGPHQGVGGLITGRINGPFMLGEQGPGGWWILPEPGIELPNQTNEISPDIAGWRRDRLAELPRDAAITVVPDWVCEILSPTTRRHNLLVKRPYYAKVGVGHHWVVDIEARALTAYRLDNSRWVELGVYSEETEARIDPFADVAFDVSTWWL